MEAVGMLKTVATIPPHPRNVEVIFLKRRLIVEEYKNGY